MSDLPKREDFLKALNTKFRIFFDDENPTEVELKEVSELRQKSKFEAFSIVFAAPKTVPLQAMTFHVEHDALDAMQIFMGPIEETEDSYLFEALFNQPITAVND